MKPFFISFLFIPGAVIGEIAYELLTVWWNFTDYDGFYAATAGFFNPIFKGLLAGFVGFNLVRIVLEKFNIEFQPRMFISLNLIPALYACFFIYLALGDFNQDLKDTFTIVLSYILYFLMVKFSLD
jgi:fructose-specific phosphotransferase system IIC component